MEKRKATQRILKTETDHDRKERMPTENGAAVTEKTLKSERTARPVRNKGGEKMEKGAEGKWPQIQKLSRRNREKDPSSENAGKSVNSARKKYRGKRSSSEKKWR